MATTANAELLDLTGPTEGVSVTATAALGGTYRVTQIDAQSTGTGVIDPFVRINPGGSETQERGYNTDVRPLQFDENSSPSFTTPLLLSEVPVVNVGGTLYRQFLLDINQQGADPLLSLNQIQIFQSAAPLSNGTLTEATATTFAVISFQNAVEVFRMSDLNSGDEIRLNYALNAGSGSGDMFLYIPVAVFSEANGAYVTLFSQFGTPNGPNDSNDGFEEWATLQGGSCPPGTPGCDFTPVPEPTSLLLLSGGLAMLARRVRRRTT